MLHTNMQSYWIVHIVLYIYISDLCDICELSLRAGGHVFNLTVTCHMHVCIQLILIVLQSHK